MLSWRTHALSGTIGGSSRARSKLALALPLFRRLQSSTALEPPIVRLVLSDRGGRQLPAWRTKRTNFLRVSPNDAILERINSRGRRVTKEQWHLFQKIAGDRSTRLPVMTAQLLFRQDETATPTSLSERLGDDDDPEQWKKRLEMLAYTGITEEDLRRWVRILQGETADERVQRFLSDDGHKPVFLLSIMIAEHHSILDRQLFVSLLDYIAKTYCQPSEQRLERRTLDARLNMTPKQFVEMLQTLVHRALRLCPETLVTIAEITTSYLDSVSAVISPSSHDGGYTAQCHIFNQALELFSNTAPLRPFLSIKYNWEAQKHLLAHSTNLKRPFIINEAGYRAIQSVMVAREKSEEEVKLAVRSSPSWPPYREAWDGTDEQRRPEDDLSRAVKAGILAREAGYPAGEVDRALGTLAGAVLGEGRSIQTRSVPHRPLTGRRAAENIYLTWAARVRATRNAQEAWAIFRQPPNDIIKPSAAVYAEMFAKLLAGEVADPASAVPGTTRENMPVYQPGNLSEFEKWRLQPPTVPQLYERMLAQGVRPVGQVLRLLVAAAESEAEVLRYLGDSPFTKFAAAVRDKDKSCPPGREEFFEVEKIYKSVPLNVFGAYVSFLCKMQRRAYADALSPDRLDGRVDNSYFQRTLAVVSVRLRPETVEGRTYMPPWYDLLRTLVLARTHGALVTVARKQVGLFLDLFKWVRTLTGMDAVLLEIMCLSVGRVMAANFTKGYRSSSVSGLERWWTKADHVVGEEHRKTLARAQLDVVAAFEEMKKPATGLGGFHVYSYVRVLGMYGLVEEMVGVMGWVFTKLEEGASLEGANEDGTASHVYLLRAMGFVEGYVGRVGGKTEEVDWLRARRRWLVEEGLPFEIGEGQMSERDKEDVLFVRDVAEGWARHVDGSEGEGEDGPLKTGRTLDDSAPRDKGMTWI